MDRRESDALYMKRFNLMRDDWLRRHGKSRRDLAITRKGKKIKRVSASRDRDCIRILAGNPCLAGFSASAPSVITIPKPPVLSSIEHYQATHERSLLDPGQFDWRSLPSGLPLWSDATASLRLVYVQHALDMAGPSIGFTLNLSDALVTKFKSSGHRLVDAFRRRLGYHLEAALGRKADFWFVMETPHGRLRWHLHGAVAVSTDEKPEAKRALLMASGIAAGVLARRFALRLSPLYDSLGWAGYACKYLAASAEKLGYSPAYAARSLSAPAREIYEVHRRCAAAQRIRHQAFLRSRRHFDA